MSLKQFFALKMVTITGNQVFGLLALLALAILGTGLGSTAYAAGCDPVIAGMYDGKVSYSAVYSSCTSTVSLAENTVAIKYNPGGYIDTVVTLTSAFTPTAPASTNSIGKLANFYGQDMGSRYSGNCRDMNGRLNATPAAVTRHYYCFRFEGSAADLYLGASYSSLANTLGDVTASIVFPPTADNFITTWQTDNPGSSDSTSITVPMSGGPYDVDWDNDGIFDELGISGAVTHDFLVAGTYTIRIRGNYDTIRFSGAGDTEKLISLDQWGTNSWTSMAMAFFGAVNLTVPATDVPDLSAVEFLDYMFAEATLANPNTKYWDTSSATSMSLMFYKATSANPDTSGWDTAGVTTMYAMFFGATSADPNTSGWVTSKVTTMESMFAGATSANPDIRGWDTSLVTDMTSMFDSATSFDRNIGGWNVTSLTTATNMFVGVTLSLANYEGLLLGWDAQVLKPGVRFSGGDSVYCSASAAAARANMTSSDSWVISDGGQACPVEPCNVNTVTGVTEYGIATHEACEILTLGPDFIAAFDENVSTNVSANSGWEINFPPGFTVEQGATFEANVCGQSLCMISDFPMPDGCHSCVTAICDVDTFCCTEKFDSTCLTKVDTVCGLVCE